MAFTLDTPSYALIDGVLCKLNRKCAVVRRHAPMGLLVEEFLVHEDRILVRESGDGVLLGMTNLYCLDADLRLRWLAESLAGGDVYAGPLSMAQGHVCCPTRLGKSCELALEDGLPIRGEAMALLKT